MDPNDKTIILAYAHETNLLLDKDLITPKEALRRLNVQIAMIQRAAQGIDCLACGFAWALHPKNADGTYLCLSVAMEEVRA